jgi:hypothetical protein
MLLMLLIPVSGRAQRATVDLVGTVRDGTGAVLPGVEVTLTEVETNISRSVMTDQVGVYNIIAVPAGRYSLEASLQGFKKKRMDGIVLEVAQRTRLDVVMEVGQVSETIEVKGSAPLVNTETAAIGQVTNEKAILQLPLNGRDFTQLIGLTPGVVAGSNIGVGIPAAANRINLDGGNDIEPFNGGISLTPILDTLQEFRVQVGQYTAEYGLGGAVMVDAVTKSGSNQIHGTLWEFHRNRVLDAAPWATQINAQGEKPKPPLIRNQYGFTIGGPIKKNRTFAFGAYEGLKLPGSQTFVGNLPTAAERAGDLSNYARNFNKTIVDPFTKVPFPNNVIPANRLDPISQNIVKALFVDPNNPGNPTRNWVMAQPSSTDQYNWSVRADQNISSAHNLFARFSLADQLLNRVGANSIGMPLPYGDVINSFRGVNTALGLTSGFTPTLLNTMLISYNRSFNRNGGVPGALDSFGGCLGLGIKEPQCRPNTPLGGLPGIRIDQTGFRGEAAFFSIQSTPPVYSVGQTYQLQNNLTWLRRNHTFKFGIDVQRHLAQNYNDIWPSTRFEAAYSGDGFSDFLLGIPNVVSGRLDIPTTSDLYNMYWAGYIQDDWKASPNLTINIGMRYEVATPIVERHGYPGQFDPLLGTGRPFEMQKGDCPKDPRACGGILYPKNNTTAKGFYTNLRPDIPYGILDSDSIFDTDKNNWAPRFGFAWRPFSTTRTVIRGGYGINYYFKPLLNFARFIGQIPPADVRTSLTASPTNPVFTWDTLSQSAISGVNLAQAYETNTAVGRENLNPYIQQWSLSVAQEIAQDTVFEAEYVGSKSTHTQISVDLELAPFDPDCRSGGTIDCSAPATRIPFVKFAQIAGYYYGGWGNYNGGIFSVRRRYATGLSLSAGYTFSNAMGGGGGYWQAGDGNGIQNPNDRSSFKYQSGDNVRHSFNSYTIWDLPFGHGRKYASSTPGWVDALLGGWQTSGIFIARTGFPIPMQVGRQFCNNTTGFAIRCFPNRLGREGDTEPLSNGVDSPKYLASDFPVPDNAFGNSGQNVLFQNGLWNFDWAMNKSVNIHERARLEFRFEAFNVLNHPTFATGMSGNSGAPASFGRTLTAGEPRRLQLGLKLHF